MQVLVQPVLVTRVFGETKIDPHPFIDHQSVPGSAACGVHPELSRDILPVIGRVLGLRFLLENQSRLNPRARQGWAGLRLMTGSMAFTSDDFNSTTASVSHMSPREME